MKSAAKAANRAISPVLVLGSEPRIAVTIARSLHRRGIPVDVCRLGSEPDVKSASVRRSYVLPSASADAGRQLVEIVEEQGYNYIMPTSDTALAVIVSVYDELAAITGLSCPPPDRVRSVLDKDITLRVARDVGLPTPGTSLEAISGPMVVKPVDKAYRHPFKVRYFSTTEDYQAALAAAKAAPSASLVSAAAVTWATADVAVATWRAALATAAVRSSSVGNLEAKVWTFVA